ncbi:MAG: hypothetical protein K8W52_29360 [Deltaproteobacteria bacterium]|nr:hypothetical protein [Deltaproteobacteria bacterium]
MATHARGRCLARFIAVLAEPLLEQVEDLRRRTDKLDLEASRGEVAIHAAEEAIGDIDGLADILRRALAEGAHIIFN